MQHHRLFGVKDRDRQAKSIRSQGDRVPHSQFLVFRQDAVGAVDFEAHGVLDPVVAVKAAPTLAELHEPGPDLGRGRVDRDGMGGTDLGVRHQFIPW